MVKENILCRIISFQFLKYTYNIYTFNIFSFRGGLRWGPGGTGPLSLPRGGGGQAPEMKMKAPRRLETKEKNRTSLLNCKKKSDVVYYLKIKK